MRLTSTFPLAATAVTAFTFIAAIVLIPDFARADEVQQDSGSAQCSCPDTDSTSRPSSRPKYADLKAGLDVSDEIATLETLQLALSEVGDGSTYVWHRHHGRLSGVITPTTSFKTGDGQICRHVIVVLTSGPRSKRSEGVACRLASGQWRLEG